MTRREWRRIGDADVVFELTDCGAAESKAVNGQIEDVLEALMDAEGLEEFGVGGALPGLDAEATFDCCWQDGLF